MKHIAALIFLKGSLLQGDHNIWGVLAGVRNFLFHSVKYLCAPVKPY